MKFGFNQHSNFSGKEVWKCWIWVALDQDQWMTLTVDIHIGPCTHLVNCIYQLWHHRLQLFLKYPLIWMTLTVDIHTGPCTHLVNCIYQLWHHRLQLFLKYPLFYLFPIQKHKGPNLTLPLNTSRSTQVHHFNKFVSTRAPNAANQVSRSLAFWFRRRNFLRFLPYMGMAAILVKWPGPFEQIFVPLSQGGSIRNLASIDPVVSEEKMFENVDTYTHTYDSGLPIL